MMLFIATQTKKELENLPRFQGLSCRIKMVSCKRAVGKDFCKCCPLGHFLTTLFSHVQIEGDNSGSRMKHN